jgi:hypothetical protein
MLGAVARKRAPRLIVALALVSSVTGPARAQESWKSEWSVPDGFALNIDVEGFDLPTSIAMVPNPGPGPKDAIYFVTELFGKVKVVTRDRSVFTFAEKFFDVKPEIPPPSTWGEIGMAGIALDEKRGYVFVSFLFHDSHKIMRNGMVRFQSKPGTFGLKSEGMTSFNKIFEKESAWVNYHIGPILVDDDKLFVAVGDGGKPFSAQDLEYTTGKILRMTEDGLPLPDNPFYVDNNPYNAKNLVWAYGFRNVFGLSLVNGRLLASENGIDIDRFIEIRKGENYGWDGTDWSIGMNAPMVFGKTIGPAQLTWVSPENAVFPPEHRSKFYMAMSYGQNLTTGVVSLEYDFATSRMKATPRNFLLMKPPPNGLDWRPGAIIQKVVGVGLAPDGLYVVVMYPVRKEQNAKAVVFRVSYDPPRKHAYVLDRDRAAETLMNKHACWYCHSRDPEKKKAAPTLGDDSLVPRLLTELQSPEYAARVRAMHPRDGFGDLRKKLMEVEGVERVRRWIHYRLKSPLFDRPAAAMPAFNMDDAEAATIASYLIERYKNPEEVATRGGRFKAVLDKYLDGPKYKHIPVASAFGFLVGIGGTYVFLRRRKRHKETPVGSPPTDESTPKPEPESPPPATSS